MIVALKVFNTVTALGADAAVGTDGFLRISGVANTIDARSILSIQKQVSVAETLQVQTVTPSTVSSNADYTLVLGVFDTTSGVQKSIPVTINSGSSATANSISTAFVNAINSMSGLSVTAALSTNDLQITARTGFAIFTITKPTSETKLTINAASPAGVQAVNTGALLLQTYYNGGAFYQAGQFPEAANIESSSTYTSWTINYLNQARYGATVKPNELFCTVVVLVKEGVTNVNTLNSDWGIFANLAAGYRATIAATGANVAVSSNVATRASGSFITEKIAAGDQFGIGTTAYPILASYTTGAAAGVDKAVVDGGDVTSSAAFIIKRYPLPL